MTNTVGCNETQPMSLMVVVELVDACTVVYNLSGTSIMLQHIQSYPIHTKLLTFILDSPVTRSQVHPEGDEQCGGL